MDFLSGYDRMMLAEDPTEVNEPITSQSSEMPSPYEDQNTEEETFNALAQGATIFDGMGAVTVTGPAPGEGDGAGDSMVMEQRATIAVAAANAAAAADANADAAPARP